MKIFLCLLAITASAFAGDIRVLTFNLRYDNAGDGLDTWANRRETATALINAQADLAGLQEVLPGQRHDVVEGCKEFTVLGVGREPGDKGEGSPILFRTARFSALASGTFWLSETPETVGSKSWESALPRICTWAKLKETETGLTFYYFNTHLDHKSQAAREHGLAVIVERIKARGGEEPVLLTGDFNVGPENPALAVLPPLLDSAYTLTGVAPAGTFHGFSGKPGKGAIDYVFALHERWEVKSIEILKTSYQGVDGQPRWPSDHFPVRAVVAPKP